MAKNLKTREVESEKPVKLAKGLTAATYSPNGKAGKPEKPAGMPDSEWWKVRANTRVPLMLNSMKKVARLAAMEGFNEKIAARIVRDAETYLDAIRNAFANPNPKKSVKAPTQRYC